MRFFFPIQQSLMVPKAGLSWPATQAQHPEHLRLQQEWWGDVRDSTQNFKKGLSKTREFLETVVQWELVFWDRFLGSQKTNFMWSFLILFVVQWELVISKGLFRKANCVWKYPSANFNDRIDLLEMRRRLASERCAARETMRWLAIPCLWSLCPKATELQIRC